MNEKVFAAVIYLKDGKAVKDFADFSVVAEDPVGLAALYCESNADTILVFDLSDQKQQHMEATGIIRHICEKVDIPVYAGGCIESFEDASMLLAAGCEKVILNFAKEQGQVLLQPLAEAFGSQHIAVTIASADNLVINRENLEKYAGELILIDEHALKKCLGASLLPCIVCLPEIALDKMLMILEKPNVSGISGNIVNQNRKELSALKSICIERSIPVHVFQAPIPFSDFKLLSDGLMPVVVQDYLTGQVLMVAYMNEEAYLTTLRTRKMTYYSRSRKELWIKGLTSGHYQYVKSLSIDCDNDTLLAKVKQMGAACHTGNYSCFYRDILPMAEADQKGSECSLNKEAGQAAEKIVARTKSFVQEIQMLLDQDVSSI